MSMFTSNPIAAIGNNLAILANTDSARTEVDATGALEATGIGNPNQSLLSGVQSGALNGLQKVSMQDHFVQAKSLKDIMRAADSAATRV